MDVRDFIFLVVEQPSYNAQKDLQKPKQRAFHQLGIEPNSARGGSEFEEAAWPSQDPALRPGPGQGTGAPVCRLVELQEGNASCWWRVGIPSC